jgi:hypothetical protein
VGTASDLRGLTWLGPKTGIVNIAKSIPRG